MNNDITFPLGEGIFNFRVGAIVIKENHVLFCKNITPSYYYTIGGRVKFGEPAEHAIIREIEEELGLQMKFNQLLYITQNFFKLDKRDGEYGGNFFHEVCFYYLITVSDKDEISNFKFKDDGLNNFFAWLPIDKLDRFDIRPIFLKTELLNITNTPKIFTLYQ